MKHFFLSLFLMFAFVSLTAQEGNKDEGDYEAQWMDVPQSEIEGFILEQFTEAGEAFDQKEYEQALKALQVVQEVVPDDPVVIANVAGCLIELQRYEDAETLLKKAQKLEPTATYIYNNKGVMYSKQGKYSLAMAQYQKAIQIDPKNYSAYNNMANAALSEDKLDLAAKYMTMALKREKKSATLLNNAGAIAMRRDAYDDAERYFQKAIKKFPKYYKSYLSMSDLEGRRENPDQAIKYIDKAMNLAPGRAENYAARGVMYLRQDRFAKAKVDLEKALSIQRNNNYARLYYGITLGKLGEYEKARQAIETVANDDDFSDAAKLELANLHKDAEKYDAALAVIENYLLAKPKNAEAWRLKGLILSKMGKDRDAQIAYSRATKLNGGDAVSYINQAVPYYNKQDFAGVLKIVQQAENNKVVDLKLAEMKVVSLINLKRENDIPKAIKAAERAGANASQVATYWGQFHMTIKGDFNSAVPYFSDAIKKDPRNGMAYYYRAFCYANLGDRQKAKADAAKGKQVGDASAKSSCQNLLDQL
ncbi:MAG: tetratricopeptide repeat protein [Bacteroidia bacterium]